MKIIGVTGGSGAGKTTITKIMENFGAEVVDADVVAREVVMEGQPALKEIENQWENVVDGGKLNRKALAKIVFNDESQLHKLNSITHKYIIDLIKKKIKKSCASVFVIDAIALFESGLSDLCDVTVCVIADKDTRINRIMARDNLTKLEAEERINAQKDDGFYIKNADHTIYNDDDECLLKEKIGRIIKGC